MLPNQIILPYDCTGSRYIGSRCPRRGRAKSQLPVDVLSDAQIGRHISAYLQLQAAESVRYDKIVSTLQSFPFTRVSAESGLDGETRFDQAYFHVTISQQHRRFLRINYHRDPLQHQLLQMTCLPFGLSSVPRTFATITNWVAEFLRNHGIRCVVFLDDFLLANQSKEQLQNNVAFTVKTMQTLCWTVNYDKSVLVPTQCLEFLGITWDTKRNAKSLSERKCLSLRKALHEQLEKGKWSLKQYQSLMGRLNFTT